MKNTIVAPKNIAITEIDCEPKGMYLEWGNVLYEIYFSDEEECWYFYSDCCIEMLTYDDVNFGYRTKNDMIEILKQRIAENINEAYLEG